MFNAGLFYFKGFIEGDQKVQYLTVHTTQGGQKVQYQLVSELQEGQHVLLWLFFPDLWQQQLPI